MLGSSENRMYLTVSYGRLRTRAKEGDPGAKSRETKSGHLVWERIYNYIQGTLEKIFYRTHEDFGNSWVLLISDGQEQYSVQVDENSRFGDDLAKKIPNLCYGVVYKFTPYDFEDNNKRRCGLSIKIDGRDPVPSFYHEFEKGPDGKTIVHCINGLTAYDGDWKDHDEVKIYFMRTRKFLREKALLCLKAQDEQTGEQEAAAAGVDDQGTDPNDPNDLPF